MALNAFNVIKRVSQTEKTHSLLGSPEATLSVLTVIVDKAANKNQITEAVTSLFGVQVVAVNSLNVKGKTKNRGNRKGRRSDFKKAYVTIVNDTQASQLSASTEE